ncbi:MAG: DUF3090 domain-containing protein [Anaerolineae bacterium]
MANRVTDIHSSRITVDALGRPGERVFLLQASEGDATFTFKIEKQQAAVLALSIDRMLEELAKRFPREISRLEEPLSSDLMLREPIEVFFVVGQMGMGYDQSEDAVVLVLQELIEEEAERSARVARIWASRAQMKALSHQIKEVISRGRPICSICGQPIDPDGHFCPRSNGRERIH